MFRGWSALLRRPVKRVAPYLRKYPDEELQKSEIANALGARYGYTSYLEISVPTTGFQHRLIDRDQFSRCERIVYAVPEKASVDEDVTRWTSEDSSSSLIGELAAGEKFDLVFSDPFHSYDNSFEDILGAFSLVRPGGALVVHDCNPRDPAIVSPHFISGAWCGVTYWAYIDFVISREGISYYTVDTDYGCGVVFKRDGSPRDVSRLEFEWLNACRNDETRYAFFDLHREKLLNLISVDEFCLAIGT